MDDNSKKIKVVWLCHFANQQMKDLFNVHNINEFAPWISLSIELFKKESNIELHLVSPNIFNNKDVEFIKDGVHYYFFKYLPIPLFNRYTRKLHSLSHFDVITDFFWIKNKVKKIVTLINPAIVHLHGAENAFFYSSGILPIIDKYPHLTTIQGFVRNTLIKDSNSNQRIRIEEKIIKKTTHFGVRRTNEMESIVSKINTNAIFHYHNYPISIPKTIKDNIGLAEPIDCIFFARVCKDKGIEDLLEAISIVKLKLTNVSLTVVGDVDFLYAKKLEDTCESLSITNNVRFVGFLPTQDDIHAYAYNAKICLLPTYHDILPGTILESMFLKLPVIAYAVGGLPELNLEYNTINLVEKFRIDLLAKEIIFLLDNVDARKKLAEDAFNFVNKKFDNRLVTNDIIKSYQKILNLPKSTQFEINPENNFLDD
ncbi:MAG: hypothetical protein CVU13_10120 [Bacteroidetes bacterium HGW-Bacteroidetes-8]|jgi:glycosyltransferase involved in cell wall biosynthesis|nr:MAG: hypothetical protein CVU13_10120 [Bacteroidetes bacterium HGW-Bacteroidetes-8]